VRGTFAAGVVRVTCALVAGARALRGPGFTEVKVENMEKMGGVGDLGDSAAAYGSPDGATQGKDSLSQAGHIDQYTYGDAMADKAEAAKQEAIAKAKTFEAAKRQARGF
jgi:hypothetical protein